MQKIAQPSLIDLPGLELAKSYCIIGAPATGKTRSLLRLVSELEEQHRPEEILVLTSSRRQSSILRDQIALQSKRASSLPRAQSVSAFAFRLLGARGSGRRLLTGANQERILRSLVAKHEPTFRAMGISSKSVQLNAFIQELRDLLGVVLDFNLSSQSLDRLQKDHPKLKLNVLSVLFDDYLKLIAGGGWLDSSTLLTEALECESEHRILLVDDAQEMSTAALALIARQLETRPGLIFGDPDAGTQGYRAAEAGSFLALGDERIYLSGRPALNDSVVASLQRVSARMPASGAGPQREVLVSGERPSTALFESTAAEADYLAAKLRRLSLEQGIPFSEMAIVLRTQSQIEQVAKDLSLRNLPIRFGSVLESMAKNQLTRAMLEVSQLIWGNSNRQAIVEILQSSLFSLTAIQLRRLDRQLSHHFGLRTEAAWSEALELGVELDTFEARALNRLLDALRQLKAMPPTSAHELVSRIFDLAPSSLRDAAKSKSLVSKAINRDLDAVLRLFAAAIRFDQQAVGEFRDFVAQQLDQRVVEDAIYAEQLTDAVTLTTASNLSGVRYRVVAMPRLQDGIWPNLKLRNSLLGASSLRSYLAGRSASPTDEVRGELADELRLFYKALGAASETLLLSAMQGEEEQPSQFFTLLGSEPILNQDSVDFDLRRFVGRLRHALASGDNDAAGMLGVLALADVPGAHPSNWQGLLEPSSADAIYTADEQVILSASSLDAFEKCPIHWFIETFAVGKQSFQASIGTLLHRALELAKAPEDIKTYVESNWHELEFELGWQERAQRQRAMEMAAYLASYLQEAGAAISAEESFELELGRLRIRGKIDRIESTSDGLVVADLKTGKSLPDAKTSKQLAIYQLAMIRKHGPENIAGAKLISVGTGALKTVEQPKLGEEQLTELHAAFDSFEKETSSGALTAFISSHCDSDSECSLLLREVH